MKNIFLFLMTFLLSAYLRVEYQGFHIKFKIENYKGQKSIGYVNVHEDINQDSLSNTNYIKKSFGYHSGLYGYENDSLTYFKEIIKYEFNPDWDSSGKKQPIYYLTNEKIISFKSIKILSIVKIIHFGTLIGIANRLRPSDTTWMKNAPIKRLSFGGYQNNYQIFIHENSPKLTEILKQLERKQNKVNSIILQYEIGHTDPEEGAKIDDDFWEEIQKLNGHKVVVIVEGGG